MNGVRYLIQTFVMLGDILLIVACALVLHAAPTSLFVWILVGLGFHKWYQTGAFEAWTPAGIKAFITNAKQIGL